MRLLSTNLEHRPDAPGTTELTLTPLRLARSPWRRSDDAAACSTSIGAGRREGPEAWLAQQRQDDARK